MQHGGAILTARPAFGLWRMTASAHRRNFVMANLDDRQKGFEKKFAIDEELKFKANARRNKLLGLWAAEKLGKSGAEAEEYAKSVVRADFEEVGDDDVFRKIRADFDAASVEQSDHQIRRTMQELMAEAIDQVKNA
jgi:hypothetical protein